MPLIFQVFSIFFSSHWNCPSNSTCFCRFCLETPVKMWSKTASAVSLSVSLILRWEASASSFSNVWESNSASFLSSWFSLFLSERCDSPLKGTSGTPRLGLAIQQQDLGNRTNLVEDRAWSLDSEGYQDPPVSPSKRSD